MRYVLISENGKVTPFYYAETAKVWKQAYGGTIIELTADQSFQQLTA
jgi:hypothetical protein